jgi:hypothetical protein
VPIFYKDELHKQTETLRNQQEKSEIERSARRDVINNYEQAILKIKTLNFQDIVAILDKIFLANLLKYPRLDPQKMEHNLLINRQVNPLLQDLLNTITTHVQLSLQSKNEILNIIWQSIKIFERKSGLRYFYNDFELFDNQAWLSYYPEINFQLLVDIYQFKFDTFALKDFKEVQSRDWTRLIAGFSSFHDLSNKEAAEDHVFNIINKTYGHFQLYTVFVYLQSWLRSADTYEETMRIYQRILLLRSNDSSMENKAFKQIAAMHLIQLQYNDKILLLRNNPQLKDKTNTVKIKAADKIEPYRDFIGKQGLFSLTTGRYRQLSNEIAASSEPEKLKNKIKESDKAVSDELFYRVYPSSGCI